jgi:PncC family amidohydrolase
VTDPVERASEALASRGLRLAVAESCTGGLLTAMFTARPGASRFLTAGLVTYSDDAKRRLLGVRPETLERHGAVSEAAVREMLRGARAAGSADAGVAITGIAGPDGGTAGKPVGTVWIAASVLAREEIRRFLFDGDRNEVRRRSVDSALEMLIRLTEADT